MVFNKKRLYIALYPSGVYDNEERRYHLAFLIGPKSEKGEDVPGIRYHAKTNFVSGWEYEEKAVTDVEDEQRLTSIFENLLCRTWVAKALTEIANDGKCAGVYELDWSKFESLVRQYIAQKVAVGRYDKAEDLLKPEPTYDLLEDKETVS